MFVCLNGCWLVVFVCTALYVRVDNNVIIDINILLEGTNLIGLRYIKAKKNGTKKWKRVFYANNKQLRDEWFADISTLCSQKRGLTKSMSERITSPKLFML